MSKNWLLKHQGIDGLLFTIPDYIVYHGNYILMAVGTLIYVVMYNGTILIGNVWIKPDYRGDITIEKSFQLALRAHF